MVDIIGGALEEIIILVALLSISIAIVYFFRIKDFILVLLMFAIIIVFFYAWGILSSYWVSIAYLTTGITLFAIYKKFNQNITRVVYHETN